MIRTRKLAVAAQAMAVAGMATAAVACGTAHTAAAGARVSAAATSTVARAGETDAKQLLAHCIPASTLTQIQLLEPRKGKADREGVMNCMGVPAPDRQAAAACALNNVEHGGKLPKGRQAKELALLDDAYPCVKKYQDAAPSPTASGK
jgi:hypothetical protein